MPFVWQDPEIALIHRGIRIYHVYRNDSVEERLDYYYSFGTTQEDPSFDVRTFKCPHDWDVKKEEDRRRIIRLAIETNPPFVPEEFQPECKHENLILASYQVANANTSVRLARNADTGEVVDFEFNRIDGEVSAFVFLCEDCGGEFEWKAVKGF